MYLAAKPLHAVSKPPEVAAINRAAANYIRATRGRNGVAD
jgi:hypothetical protein